MNPTELAMRRRNVAAFIKADPVSLTLQRKAARTKTAAGGWVTGDPVPLAPQQARIVLNKRRYNNGVINSEAGDIPKTDYLLIATHDKDVALDDQFDYKGETYRVTGIHKQRVESILASIDMLGPVDNA